MALIDVYAAEGTFSDKHKLAQDLAKAVMKWENVRPVNLFNKNTAATWYGSRCYPPSGCDFGNEAAVAGCGSRIF